VVEDITERKQAEFNYRRELAYNQALVNHTSAFIVVMDTEGRFVHANTAFYTTMGYRPKEVRGKTAWEIGLMDDLEVPRSKERFARLLRGEDNPPADVRLRAKNGEWHTIELRSTSTRKPDGSPDRIIITGTDMTERNRLQREVLRVVEQEQARVGHDLHDGVGQTMTGMVIMMEALEAELNGEAKVHARRIHELMNESVAEVRRMSHGLSPTSVKYRGLGGALNLLAETVRTNFRNPCSCDVDATIVINNDDKEAHLFRIAQEAVNNALRHGRPDKVKISLRGTDQRECELRIEDDGVGIKKPKSPQENANGGIGMRVMEYRANLIGGRLKIQNRPKHGVIVTCHFECDEAKKAKSPKKRKPAK
jgi:PAS domain S-box-containing protein